jgi:hypothetical protein
VEHQENVIVKRHTEDVPGYGPMDWAVIWSLWRCPGCEQPTLWRYAWSDDIGEPMAEERLYPTARDNSALPDKVRKRYDAALRVRRIDPDFYAAGIRRMVETICNHEGAQGQDLFHKLDDLASKGRIPETLAKMAHQLRTFGRIGVHDEEIEVASADVPIIEDFAEAILEYMYRAPAKLAAVTEGLKERRLKATSSTDA